MMLKWLHSFATAISGKSDNRVDTATLVAMDKVFRDSGEPIEPQAPAEREPAR
jgi:hypothetical protein